MELVEDDEIYLSEKLPFFLTMSGYGSIGNISPPARESADSEEERDSIRTPLVLPKGRRGMRRQPASQVDNKLFRVSNTFAPILRGFQND